MVNMKDWNSWFSVFPNHNYFRNDLCLWIKFSFVHMMNMPDKEKKLSSWVKEFEFALQRWETVGQKSLTQALHFPQKEHKTSSDMFHLEIHRALPAVQMPAFCPSKWRDQDPTGAVLHPFTMQECWWNEVEWNIFEGEKKIIRSVLH